MFYTMTPAATWPYARWRGPIYAGNNLAEDQQWDKEFVRQFARLHNPELEDPEIAGWGIHLYGNYQYGPKAGDPNAAGLTTSPKRTLVPSCIAACTRPTGILRSAGRKGIPTRSS